MAGTAQSSCRELWQFISEPSRPQELITLELNRNKEKLINGLFYYKKQISPVGEGLKEKHPSLQGEQLDLVKKISQFVGVDEIQSYEVYRSFLQHGYRGSIKDMQALLYDDRHVRSLVLKTRDYYFSERLYLLKCVKHLLTYWHDPEHAYRVVYEDFLTNINEEDKLIGKILDQYESVCREPAPTWEKNGNYMTEQQSVVWLTQNLSEQCELLEILMLYYKEYQHSVDKMVKLLKLFKEQGFGSRQINKHLLNRSTDVLVKRIGHLQVLVILEGLDLEYMYKCQENGSVEAHHLLLDRQQFKELDQLLCSLGDSVHHGPLLLAWAAVRQVVMDTDGMATTRNLGNTSLQLNVFHYMTDLLYSPPFNEGTFVGRVSLFVVYGLLCMVLIVFHEDTLGDTEVLYQVAAEVLKQPFVAEDMWERGLDSGIGPLLQSASSMFPYNFTSLLQLTTSLAKASKNSALKVLKYIQRLQTYTEPLDVNRSGDLVGTEEEGVWRLVRKKHIFGSESIVFPAGTLGQLLPQPGLGGHLIQWESPYYGWELCLCVVHSLVQQITMGQGMVNGDTVSQVEHIAKLLEAVLSSGVSVELVEQFEQILKEFYTIIHRFSPISTPPLELISSCLEVVAIAAKQQPNRVWHCIQQTGLLPFWTENFDNVEEAASGSGLNAGCYGLILAGQECPLGRYTVTKAVLNLVDNLIEPLSKLNQSNELSACVVLVLHEIFPVHQKWRYSDLAQRDDIGKKCLEIFHKILNVTEADPEKNRHVVSLRQISVYSLLFTEAGHALLRVVAVGVDALEHNLAMQSSDSFSNGPSLVLLVRLAFSVLNRLLLLRPPDQPLSPVEQSLFSQPAHHTQRHLVSVIAHYIYFHQDPRLPVLATLMLKRLAMVSPMSLLACLGNDAEALREVYLTRLAAYTEDMRLKVVILELLTVSVETQPGLFEMFLNVLRKERDDKGDKNDKEQSKKKTFSEGSIIQVLLDIIKENKQLTYHCLPSLLRAATEFLQALWWGHRETAIAGLKEKSEFWTSLFAPVLRDLTAESQQSDHADEIKTAANVLRIVAMEVYSTANDKLDSKLKTVLDKFKVQKRILYWSKIVKDVISDESEHLCEDLLEDQPAVQLLRAWNMLMVVTATQKTNILSLSEDQKLTILSDISESLHKQLSFPSSPLQLKLSSMCSALYVTLLQHWASSVEDWVSLIPTFDQALLTTCANSETLLPTVQVGILGALTIAVQQIKEQNMLEAAASVLANVLPTVCGVVQQSSYQLATPRQVSNDVDTKLKLQVASIGLLTELLSATDTRLWLDMVQQHSVLPALLISVQNWIQANKGFHYVRATMLMFLAMSEEPQCAEALMINGLTHHICLYLTLVYDRAQQTKIAGQNLDSDNWLEVYHLNLSLYAKLLATLRYNFLSDALNFAGVHQERMKQALDGVKFSMNIDVLDEAQATCSFIVQLSHFTREWRLQLPDVLVQLMTSVCTLSQTCVSLLIRPRLLNHVLERHSSGETKKVPAASEVSMAPLVRRLQSQTSTDDVEHCSEQLVSCQKSLLRLVSMCLCALRCFTPDLCEIMLDQSIDVSEFDAILQLGFNTPAVDQEGPPNFGTFLSCSNMCVRMLGKTERTASPGRSPNTQYNQLPRSLVMFVLENALYFMMSQAMRYLRDPSLNPRDRQYLKRELSAELNSFLLGFQRCLRRGAPPSPGASHLASPQAAKLSSSHTSFTASQEYPYFKLVNNFVKNILR